MCKENSDHMKVSDYIVEYLIKKGILDIFGYPGGMVTHFLNSLAKYETCIHSHLTYNEQGASFAACGYAQSTGKTGVAYATSGPGATNLVTGICNAYMDSVPVVFITGQVNSYEQKGELKVRQRGFQETDIVGMVTNCTKLALRVNSPHDIVEALNLAFSTAESGRKGPVLLDIAMDVFAGEVTDATSETNEGRVDKKRHLGAEIKNLHDVLRAAKRPVILLGNGVDRQSDLFDDLIEVINLKKIPVVTSMLAVDFASILENCYGFIGTYGDRAANIIVSKCDLLITVGARLDIRQTGIQRAKFAPDASIIRIDIDENELDYKVHDDEKSICGDGVESLYYLLKECSDDFDSKTEWIGVCDYIKNALSNYDVCVEKEIVARLSDMIQADSIITADVGQNQIWLAQAFSFKEKQRMLFSGGHGSMGYSLPAAIGACIGQKKKVYCFSGDGGLQMNIQELQVLSRDCLPIKVIVFNNNALGMIRFFQEQYFDDTYFHTVLGNGYNTPNFCKIADAYGLSYIRIEQATEVDVLATVLADDYPALIEIYTEEKTYSYPKVGFGHSINDQLPLIEREEYDKMMSM